MDNRQKGLRQLFFPIFIEVLFFMLVGSVDTLMLSTVGDDKVGAVGAANTYLSVFTISFSVISTGVMAVMTQYIGAGKDGVARQARNIGLIFNGIIGGVLSIVLLFWAKPILSVLGTANSLLPHATGYMRIVGGTSIFVALTPVVTYYLRAFGFTKEPLIVNVTANILNVVLNGVFLFVCDWGVEGVALATAISRAIGLLLGIIMCIRKIKIPKDAETISSGIVCKNILQVGLPSAMESALYNVAMAIVMKFLNEMSDDGIYVTAKSYAGQITMFSYCAGVALANANAIIVGWRIGEKKYDECQRATFKAAKLGVITAVVVAGVFVLTGKYVMRIFTDDPKIIELVVMILVVDFVLEIGRICNIVFGNALKTAGDATYTVVIAVIFMYLFAVLGTYVFGISLEWYVVGSWIALAMDECMRAVLMGIRWKSRKWEKKVLVK